MAGAAAAPFIWFFILPDYLKQRFFVAIHPEIDRTGKGLQQFHGRLAFGSGELFGKGIAGDNLYNKVPKAHNDFIFSYIGQIFGFVGAALVLLLLALLLSLIHILKRRWS